jgi:predicted TIM-barrel fold metal-dependent hydrolase
MMFDFHTHFIPFEVLDWLKDHKTAVNAKWEKRDPNKSDFLIVGGKWAFELKDHFYQTNLYLAEQQKAGITHSIVSPIPQLFLYDFTSEITKELSSVYNQSLASWITHHTEALSGLATVPLNDPESAAQVLDDAMNLGLKGTIIGPGCDGKLLTDDSFHAFWQTANDHQAIVFIHPLLSEDKRIQNRMMPNLIGVPWETTVCATDILLSGMLDKYPRVKILLAHGGGYLPYQIGRLDKGYEQWKAVSHCLTAPPIDYLKRFWFDNVLWNSAAQNYLIEVVGEDRVVAGTDYPFDLCAWPPSDLSGKGAKSLLGW